MKVIKIKRIEDCLESTNVRDILLDGFLTKNFIFFLKSLGKFEYNDNFAKPFFKLIVRGKYTVKGAQGNKTLRIMLPSGVDENIFDDLVQYIISYNKTSNYIE